MAESQSMTSAGVVAKALIEEHGDFLRESVAMIAAEIMEAEISRQIGAGKGEVAAEARNTHRNGYRPRPWATRVGEIELAVPRKRSGESYFPSFGFTKTTRDAVPAEVQATDEFRGACPASATVMARALRAP